MLAIISLLGYLALLRRTEPVTIIHASECWSLRQTDHFVGKEMECDMSSARRIGTSLKALGRFSLHPWRSLIVGDAGD